MTADNWASATTVVIPDGSTTYTSPSVVNTTYTTEGGEPNPSGYTAGKTAWWKYTPYSSGIATFDGSGSGDAEMAVYTGSTTAANGTRVANNSDSGPGNSPIITDLSVTSGVTYWIQMGAYLNQNLTYQLTITGPQTAAPAAGISIPYVESFPLNGGAVLRWTEVPTATSYDYSLNGGASFTNVAAVGGAAMANVVTLTSLTNGTPITAVVRAKNASYTSAWSTGTTTTPSATRYIIHLDDFGRETSGTVVGNPQVGSAYTAAVGTWGIHLSKRLYTTALNAQSLLSLPSTVNFDMSMDYMQAASAGAGFVFRRVDANNYYQVYLTNATLIMRLVRAGSVPFSYTMSDPTLNVRVVAKDSWIYVLDSNRLRFQHRDEFFGNGASTNYLSMGNTSAAYIDNVVMWNTADLAALHTIGNGTAHVYKGHDKYNEDVGATP